MVMHDRGLRMGSRTQVESGQATAMADGVLLDASGITKSFSQGWRRRLEVLRGADLRLGRGEIVGLVGENGSGKSTLMKILVGALARDAGALSRTGSLGYCPQVPVLYERLSCDEHFELFGAAYRLPDDKTERIRAELYETYGFARWATSRVEKLSGGTKAKLNLALALMHEPDLLLLDEPYAGFDWDTYLRFWDATEALRDQGRSLLIISHFITDEERFDRIVELRDGTAVQR
jgi:ABC-2 type transport system ATP-binding protein